MSNLLILILDCSCSHWKTWFLLVVCVLSSWVLYRFSWYFNHLQLPFLKWRRSLCSLLSFQFCSLFVLVESFWWDFFHWILVQLHCWSFLGLILCLLKLQFSLTFNYFRFLLGLFTFLSALVLKFFDGWTCFRSFFQFLRLINQCFIAYWIVHLD